MRWSGVARVAMQFVKVLTKRENLELVYSSAGSYYAESKVIQFLREEGIEEKFAGHKQGMLIRKAVGRSASSDGYVDKWFAHNFLRVFNRLRQPIRPEILAESDAFFSFFAGIPRIVRQFPRVRAGLYVHDVIPLLFPQYCRSAQVPILKRILGTIQEGDLVLVNSQCTRKDLCAYLGSDPRMVSVVPLAADSEIFYPVDNKQHVRSVVGRYGVLKDGYFLSLHSVAPHKNMSMLIQAYAAYRESRKSEVPPLVIAGGKDISYVEIGEALNVSSDKMRGVQFVGYVDDSDLAALYSGASTFFFPSLYEGFGLPVLEALFCGTPVIASNRASLPEIVQDKECLIEAEDIDAWKQAFGEAEGKRRLSTESICAYHDRFSWEKAGDTLLSFMTEGVSSS